MNLDFRRVVTPTFPGYRTIPEFIAKIKKAASSRIEKSSGMPKERKVIRGSFGRSVVRSFGRSVVPPAGVTEPRVPSRTKFSMKINGVVEFVHKFTINF